MPKSVTKEMLIVDILEIDDEIAEILLEAGMHCIGCPAAMSESIEDACFAHGIDVDSLIGQINEYLENLE